MDVDGEPQAILDLVNPPGVFVGGEKKGETPVQPKLSARLIPQFSGRRSIKDMFQAKAKPAMVTSMPPLVSIAQDTNITSSTAQAITMIGSAAEPGPSLLSVQSTAVLQPSQNLKHGLALVEPAETASRAVEPSPKKLKTTGAGNKRALPRSSSTTAQSNGAQKSLKNFFQPQNSRPLEPELTKPQEDVATENDSQLTIASETTESSVSFAESATVSTEEEEEKFIDPFETRDSWNKLFTKKPAPLCEGHNEPAKMMQTKKPGVNHGRSFWMCAR